MQRYKIVMAISIMVLVSACGGRSAVVIPTEDSNISEKTTGEHTTKSAKLLAKQSLLSSASSSGSSNETATPCLNCYIVKRGDTLHGIALETGQDYRDIARWNNITDLNRILVGQSLIVRNDAPSPANDKPSQTVSKSASATKTDASIPDTEARLEWSWPLEEGVRQSVKFDAAKKGIDLFARHGETVKAAATGKVVFANNNIKGYGNLIVIKHNSEYLSAYAHNSKLLVKEGQTIKKGHKIAEVGSSDSDQSKLHFEIRRFGKPIDPLKLLPNQAGAPASKSDKVETSPKIP